MTGEVRRGTCGLVAINTILGWVLSGPIRDNHPIESFVNLTSVHTLHINTVPSLDTQLAQFWELESLGIPNQELSAQTRFESFVSFDGQRYKVRLPWKKGHPPLSNNLSISEKRLSSLLHNLRCSPSLFTEYDTIIQEQLKRGTSQPPNGAKVYYMPHHAVTHKDKSTTKIRVVFDASAKAPDSVSLNDCLYSGPKYNQNILDILLQSAPYSYFR